VINLVCLGLVVIGKWNSPRENTGGFILGNFLVAILVRNEFFTRFLYLVINTLFAKVVHPTNLLLRILTKICSGHHYGSVSLAHLSSSILAAYILAAPYPASFGSCFPW
jgi:hypothetical protein